MRYLNPCGLLLAALSAASYAGPPKLPAPPKSSIGLLGEESVLNGIPMQMRQFQSELTVPQVIQYYMEHWPEGSEAEPGRVTTDAMKPWTIVTRSENGYLMTVQVKPSGKGSTGFLATSKLPDPDEEPELGKGFPVMHGTTALNDFQTRDPGKDGRTMAFLNDRSADANRDYYRNWYQARGWTMDMDKAPGQGAYVLSFRSGDKGVNIVINGRTGRTYIVAQTTNH